MNHFRFEDLREGQTEQFEVVITAVDIDQFAHLSGDVSPVHVEDAFARERGFPSRIAHGALLAAHVSRLVGVQLPGSRGVLQKLELEFRRPCVADDRLVVTGEIIRLVAALRVAVIKVTLTNLATGEIVANGKVQSGLSE